MTPVDVQRRSLLIAATGIGAGLMVPEALAQHGPSDQNGPEARMIGGIHGDMVNKLSDALKGTRPFSKDNLLELINLLSGKDVGNISLPAVLTPPQSDLVRKVVEAIYSSPDISEVAKKIEAMYKEVSDRTRDLGAAIVSIAHDSVQFAKKHQKAIFIVASDVGGAHRCNPGSQARTLRSWNRCACRRDHGLVFGIDARCQPNTAPALAFVGNTP